MQVFMPYPLIEYGDRIALQRSGRCLTYRYLRSPETVFPERSVLILVIFVFPLQLFEYGPAQHAVAFAVNKHDFPAFLTLVAVERITECLQLQLQHIGIAHSGSRVYQFVDMQIDLDRTFFGLLVPGGLMRLRLRYFLFLHGSFERLGVDRNVPGGKVVLDKRKHPRFLLEKFARAESVQFIEFHGIDA